MNTKRSLFFNTSLIYFIIISLFVGIRIFTSLVTINDLMGVILDVVIQVGVMAFIPFLLYKLICKKKTTDVIKDFNVKPIGFKAVIIAMAIGFIVYFLNLAVASFFNLVIFSTGYDPSFGMSSATSDGYPLVAFLGDLVLTALLPGICEEFCHRGLLLNGYKQLGIKKSIVLVGILFGLMHLNIEQFFYASIIGMFLTLLVYLTGSIIPSMIVHFMNNAMGLYLTFAASNNLPFGNFGKNLTAILSGNLLTFLFTIMFAVIILVSLLIGLTYLLLQHTRVREFKKLATNAIERKQKEELFDYLNVDDYDADEDKISENEPEIVFVNSPSKNRPGKILVDIKIPENNILHGDCSIKKPTLKDKAFLFGTIAMGAVITILTLVWGIL